MQQGSGFLLIVVGLLLLYVVISGKLPLFENFIYQLFGLPVPGAAIAATPGAQQQQQRAPSSSLPYGLELPKLGDVPTIDQIFGRQ